MNDKKTELQDELDWLAFCYVADELDPDQRAAFNSRLAVDPAAQQAVADAVGLGQVAYRALQETPRGVVREQRSSYRSVHARVVFAASVALALLGVGWAWYSGQFSAQAPQVAIDSEFQSSEELALTWVYSTSEDEQDWPEYGPLAAEDYTNADWNYEQDDADSGWMAVALNEIENQDDPEEAPQ